MKPIRRSGVLAHPTSFPSRYGVGDLGQGAYDFIEFLRMAGQSVWQVLPLGPTSFGDSPYQSLSTFAGNRILISPDLLAEEGYLSEADLADVPEFDRAKVDYGPVLDYKTALYRKAYVNFVASGAAAAKKAFKNFCDKNSFWLEDYALFKAIKSHFIEERRFLYEPAEFMEYKEQNKEKMTDEAMNECYYGAVWNTWPAELAARDASALTEWGERLKDEIQLIKFLQYEFFRQWQLVKACANENEIEIIGDIPIFVAMDSSDVWASPHLFCMDKTGRRPSAVAGVPPDYFSETGQLWGNPLYDWKAHKKDRYSWWISRVASCLSLYDRLRIDHFRGFESYWEVPFGSPTAEKGKWRKGPGKELFDEIINELGELPIIAEDLGDITDDVDELRDSLGFPGMIVLQFAFGDPGHRNLFLPHNITTTNRALYTGTHDNDTTLGWYESGTEKERDYFRRYMNVSGEDVSWDMIRLAFSSPAETVVVPVQDVMSLGGEHRMNTPGVAVGNWMFRYTKDMLDEKLAEGLYYFSELFERNLPEKTDEDEEENDEATAADSSAV